MLPEYLTSPYYLSGHNSYTHNIPTISDIILLSVRSQQLYTPYTHNIWYHLTLCPVITAIHTIYPQYLISSYYLSGHNSYTYHIPTISDITLLSVRSQEIYTPYTHNIWYTLLPVRSQQLYTPYTPNIWHHLSICPVTTAIHTIYPQYQISSYYLSGHNNYKQLIHKVHYITLLSVRSQEIYTPYTHNIWYTLLPAQSQQLYTPYTHNIWYHLTICPVATAIHTIYPQYLISPYYLSGHNSYTHHPSAAINASNSESPVFIYEAEGQSFRISFRNWLVTLLNSSLPLTSNIPIYYKLQNTKCSDELQYMQLLVWVLQLCEKMKRNRKIIPTINDHNWTIITNITAKANILKSYYASVFCCDRNVLEIN
jgi:hypothetical protein